MAGYAVTFQVIDQASKQIDAINRRIAQTRAPLERLSKTVARFVDVSGLRTIANGFGMIARTAMSAAKAIFSIIPGLGAITSAATIAGLVALVHNWADFDRSTRETADSLDMTANELTKMQNAARLMGGHAEDATTAMRGLHKALYDLKTGGGDVAAIQRSLAELHINPRKANGELRTTSELLPEVADKIAKVGSAGDRVRLSATLLGDEQGKLVEDMRLSGKSLEDAMGAAGKFAMLTEAQHQQLEDLSEAIGNLGVSWDNMASKAAAAIANHLTPVLNHIATFIQENQPAIIAAVDDMSKKIIDFLTFMVNHLDQVKAAAEAVVAVFALQWLGAIAGAITNITTLLGTAPGFAAAGTGLAGALAGIAAIALAIGAVGVTDAYIKGREEDEAKKLGFQKRGGSWWNPLDKIPHWVNPATGETLTEEEMRQRLGVGPSGFSPGHMPSAQSGFSLSPGAPPSAGPPPALVPGTPFTGTQKEFMDRTYSDLYDAAKAKGLPHPEIVARLGAAQAAQETGFGKHFVGNNLFGIKAGGVGTGSVTAATTENVGGVNTSTTASFAAFSGPKDAAAGYIDFVMRNPRYQEMLNAKTDAEAVAALGRSGYATDPNYAASVGRIEGSFTPPVAAPALPPPPAMASGALNGAVDINITHRNPPPDAAVTAQGTGAVNVAPPRVEHQSLAGP